MHVFKNQKEISHLNSITDFFFLLLLLVVGFKKIQKTCVCVKSPFSL